MEANVPTLLLAVFPWLVFRVRVRIRVIKQAILLCKLLVRTPSS